MVRYYGKLYNSIEEVKLKRLSNKILRIRKQINLLEKTINHLKEELGKAEAEYDITYSNVVARELKSTHQHKGKRDII